MIYTQKSRRLLITDPARAVPKRTGDGQIICTVEPGEWELISTEDYLEFKHTYWHVSKLERHKERVTTVFQHLAFLDYADLHDLGRSVWRQTNTAETITGAWTPYPVYIGRAFRRIVRIVVPWTEKGETYAKSGC